MADSDNLVLEHPIIHNRFYKVFTNTNMQNNFALFFSLNKPSYAHIQSIAHHLHNLRHWLCRTYSSSYCKLQCKPPYSKWSDCSFHIPSVIANQLELVQFDFSLFATSLA